ncbi:GNAT family N-acetyltransferase [Vannielia litorea]|uniref:GNAT family N-acetyltransferase n=1 Tax=Vannielia litorea TaxID=1217970 RepID=UPI0021BD79D1|nr:GNAT family N-acetyltransferase [Vannielia litorea]
MPITIRPACFKDARALARVQVAAWHATYSGMVPDAMLAATTLERKQEIWSRLLTEEEAPTSRCRTLLCTAGAAGEVEGFIRIGPQRTARFLSQWPGEIQILYIHPAAQGQGRGRTLLAAGAGLLNAAGLVPATLWVMSANTRARRFYERLGGAYLEEQTVPVQHESFDEVAYGWHDLSSLAAACAED